MAVKRIVFDNFDFGLSDDERGPENSFSLGRQIDSRTVPGSVIPTRDLVKESGSVVTSEVHDMVRVSNSEIYMAGGTEIYLRTSGAAGAAGTYTVHTTDPSVIGVRDLDFNSDLDKLFAYDEVSIHELYNVSGTEAWDYNKYTKYVVLNQNDGTTANGYTLLTSVTEGSANIVTFTCTREPLYSVTFHVKSKGASGDWVLTVHDGANRTVATQTIVFASVPASGSDIEFVFTSPVRLKVGAEYHVHLHATAGTHTVDTLTASQLGTADVSTKAYRLVNTGEFGHFTLQYGPKTIFCNEHYIGEWEIIDTSANATSGYDPHRVILPAECLGVGAAVYNQYVAVACGIKRGSDTTKDKMTNGVIFFWDGTSPNYEFALEIPQGTPFGLFSQDNLLYWTCEGQLYRWSGGDIESVYEFPGQVYGSLVELYRRAARRSITSDGSLIKIGWPHTVGEPKTEIAVFSWGRKKRFMPNVINYDHLISTGSNLSAFDGSGIPITGITCIKRFGSNLLVAWKDYIGGVVTYGVDFTNGSRAIAAPTTGNSLCAWFSPIIDDDRPVNMKTGLRLIINGDIGDSTNRIIPKISYENVTTTGNFNMGDSGYESQVSVEDHTLFRQCRVGFFVQSAYAGAGLTQFPRVDSLVFEYDDDTEEDNIRPELTT